MNNPKVIKVNYDPRFMMHKSEISFTKDAIKCIKKEREEIKKLEKQLANIKNINKRKINEF